MQDFSEVIKNLNEIQDDLVGILIPTILTTIISFFSLVVNSSIQLVINNRQYKSKQFEIMRNHYPKLKSKLSKITCCFDIVEQNTLYNKKFNLTNFVGFDWEEYRKSLNVEQVAYIDDYENNIKKIIDTLIELNTFFEDNNMPTSSKKVQKRINLLQNYCLYINEKQKITSNKYKTIKSKDIKKTIKILDKHYNKFC